MEEIEIQNKIKELEMELENFKLDSKKQIDEYLTSANNKVYYLQGKIDGLRDLLKDNLKVENLSKIKE